MIDKSKQYRTRDGREVRIYATDGAFQCVHGAVLHDEKHWMAHQWTVNGEYDCNRDSHLDLIEVKPRIKREVWVNVYRGREMQYFDIFDEYDDALEHHTSDTCIACVKLVIDCEEGTGL